MKSTTTVLLLALAAGPAAAQDCASYTQQALGIVAEAQRVFMQTLEKDVSTAGTRCELTGTQWSNREQRHRDWCAALPAGQAGGSIQQRLGDMNAALAACKGDVAPRLASAGTGTATGGQGVPPPPPVVMPPPPPSPPPAIASTTTTTSGSTARASGATPPCPANFAELTAMGQPPERCTCLADAMSAGRTTASEEIVIREISLCEQALESGLLGPAGGTLTIADLDGSGWADESYDPDDPTQGGAVVTTQRDGSVQTTRGMSRVPAEVTAMLDPNTMIRVVAGTYGANCPGVTRGNRTEDLREECNGYSACDYRVDVETLGDPARGCAKNYVAEWSCGSGSEVRRAEAKLKPEHDGEAGRGALVTLSCESW